MTTRHRHTATRTEAKVRHRRGALAVLALMAVSAIATLVYCLPRLETPERLARDYLKRLVTEPSAIAEDEALARSTGGAPPEALLERLAARVAVESLRARHAQGAQLHFRIAEVREVGADRRRVFVDVEVRGGADRVSPTERFVVVLTRDERGDWRLRGITEAD